MKIPGAAYGSDVAPHHLPTGGTHAVRTLADARRDRTQRLHRDQDHDRHDEDGEREAARDVAPAEAVGPRECPKGLDEDHEAEDPVDDRRHARQVADVRDEDAVHARVPRVLLQVDRRRDPDRDRDARHEARQDERSDQPLPDTGPAGKARRVARDELPPTLREHRPGLDEGGDEQDQQDQEGEQQRADQGKAEHEAGDVPSFPPQREVHGRADVRGRCDRHQYRLRTRRTNRSESRLRTNVITNSSRPTK